MRVLSWNLYHGRDHPPDPALLTLRSRLLRRTERGATHAQVNRPLLHEFATVLGRLKWDVALLQEAPPRWFPELARRTRSNGVRVLTSRNWCPPAQSRLADWNPDLMASWEGGSNQVLVRHPGRITEHRRLTLAWRPEQRRMMWARLELAEGEVCVANLHASAGLPERAALELARAAETAVEWSPGPLVLGGDLNLRPRRDPAPFELLASRHGLVTPTGPDAIDHLLARGLDVLAPSSRLPPRERELAEPDGLLLRLSDHDLVTAEFGVR